MSADQMFIEQRLYQYGKWEKKDNLSFKEATAEQHHKSIYKDKMHLSRLQKQR